MKGWLTTAIAVAVLLSGSAVAEPEGVTEIESGVSIMKMSDGEGSKVVIKLSSDWQSLPKGAAESILKQLSGMLTEDELKSVLKQLVDGKREITVARKGKTLPPKLRIATRVEELKPGLVELKPGERGLVVLKGVGEDGEVTLKGRKVRIMGGKPEVLIEEDVEVEIEGEAKQEGEKPRRFRVRVQGEDMGEVSEEIRRKVEAQLRNSLPPEMVEKVLESLKNAKGGNVWIGGPQRGRGPAPSWGYVPQPPRMPPMPRMPQPPAGGCPHCNPRPQMQGNVVGALQALTREIAMLRQEMRAMRQTHSAARPKTAPAPQMRFGVAPGGAAGTALKRYAALKAAPATPKASLEAQTQQLKKEVQDIQALLKKLAERMKELQEK